MWLTSVRGGREAATLAADSYEGHPETTGPSSPCHLPLMLGILGCLMAGPADTAPDSSSAVLKW